MEWQAWAAQWRRLASEVQAAEGAAHAALPPLDAAPAKTQARRAAAQLRQQLAKHLATVKALQAAAAAEPAPHASPHLARRAQQCEAAAAQLRAAQQQQLCDARQEEEQAGADYEASMQRVQQLLQAAPQPPAGAQRAAGDGGGGVASSRRQSVPAAAAPAAASAAEGGLPQEVAACDAFLRRHGPTGVLGAGRSFCSCPLPCFLHGVIRVGRVPCPRVPALGVPAALPAVPAALSPPAPCRSCPPADRPALNPPTLDSTQGAGTRTTMLSSSASWLPAAATTPTACGWRPRSWACCTAGRSWRGTPGTLWLRWRDPGGCRGRWDGVAARRLLLCGPARLHRTCFFTPSAAQHNTRRWHEELQRLQLAKRLAVQRWRLQRQADRAAALERQAAEAAAAREAQEAAGVAARLQQEQQEREQQRAAVAEWKRARQAAAEEEQRQREAEEREQRWREAAARQQRQQENRQALEQRQQQKQEAAAQRPPCSESSAGSAGSLLDPAARQRLQERNAQLLQRRAAAVAARGAAAAAQAERVEALQRRASEQFAGAAERDPGRLLQPTSAAAMRQLAALSEERAARDSGYIRHLPRRAVPAWCAGARPW